MLCHILPNTCQHSQYGSKTSFYHSDSSGLRSLTGWLGGVRRQTQHSPVFRQSDTAVDQIPLLADNLTEMSPISISMQILEDKRFGPEMLKLDPRPDCL